MDVLADLRIALRGLMRSKGFAAAGALTLALGIAATTTIFSVVYGVLLRPLPYRDAGRVIVIQGEKEFSTGPRVMNYSPSELEDFAGATQAFSSIAISGAVSFTLRTDAGVEPISGATVSRDFFQTLGTAPHTRAATRGSGHAGGRNQRAVVARALCRRRGCARTDR